MENVSHLFLFKGKLQTKSPLPPQIWSPPPPHNIKHNAIDMPFLQNGRGRGSYQNLPIASDAYGL